MSCVVCGRELPEGYGMVCKMCMDAPPKLGAERAYSADEIARQLDRLLADKLSRQRRDGTPDLQDALMDALKARIRGMR